MRLRQQLSFLPGQNPLHHILFPPFCPCDEAYICKEKHFVSLGGSVLVLAAFYDFVFVSKIQDKNQSYDFTVLGPIPHQAQCSLPLDIVFTASWIWVLLFQRKAQNQSIFN